MKLRDIIIGEDYAIKWGGGIKRGTITYAGAEREYRAHSDVWTNAAYTGPRVFFKVPDWNGGPEHDVPPANVIRPWAEHQAELDEKAQEEAGRDARLNSVAKTLGVTLDWKVRRNGQHSTTHVVATFEDLERLARRIRHEG